MTTPIMFTGGSTAPSGTQTNYCAPVGSNQDTCWTTIATAMRTPWAVAGTLSGLQVRFPTLGTGSFALTVRKNGVDQTLTATADLAGTGMGSDTTHSFSVAEGDQIDIKCVPSGSPTTQTEQVEISMVFTPTTPGESIILFGNRANTMTISTGTYHCLGTIDNGNGTLANRQSPMPTAGTLDKLYLNLPTAPGSGNTVALTLYKGGSAQSLTCSVADTANTSSDTSNSVSVSQNDLCALFAAATAGTPAATYIRGSMRFVPTVPGEFALFSNYGGVPAAASDRFSPVNGATNTGQAAESSAYSLVPVAFTARKLTMSLTTGPGGGTRTRSIWLRKGTGSQSDTALTAVCTNTETTANDNTNEVSVAAGDFLDIRTNSSASATSPGNFRVSMAGFISTGYTLAADGGAFTLTGTAASLEKGFLLTAAAGSFTLTGQSAGLVTAHVLGSDAGSFALTGTAASLEKGFLLGAGTGSFTLSGSAVGLVAARLLGAASGSFTLTGQDVGLTYNPGSGYALAANSGAFTFTGQSAGLRAAHQIAAAGGSFTLTGQAAGLRASRLIGAISGSFTLTGIAAALPRTYRLPVGAGTFTLTGISISFTYSGAPIVIRPRMVAAARDTRVAVAQT